MTGKRIISWLHHLPVPIDSWEEGWYVIVHDREIPNRGKEGAKGIKVS
jgi:hypothetical protein